MPIRYTGADAGTLTGIPATGVGVDYRDGAPRGAGAGASRGWSGSSGRDAGGERRAMP